MKYYLIIALSIFCMACSKKVVSQNGYLLSTNTENISKENLKNADISFEFNSETGEFFGSYKNKKFSGTYALNHTSAGFAKGFFYRVSLLSLSKDAPSNDVEEAFFNHIIHASRISIQPDLLNQPTYFKLDIISPKSQKPLTFIKYVQ